MLGNLLALLMACSAAFAADTGLTPDRLYHRSWTVKDGAPQNVGLIRQTTDGFIWLLTPTGLYRFDGVRFERFKLPKPELSGLVSTRDGGLLVSYSYGGASFIRDGIVTNYDETSSLGAIEKFKLFKDAEGTVWAFTDTSLLRFESSRWIRTSASSDFFPKDNDWWYCVDAHGTLWFSISARLYSMHKGERSFQRSSISLQVTASGVTKQGTVWIGSGSSLLRINDKGDSPKGEHGTQQTIRLSERMNALGELIGDDQEGLWFRTEEDGVYRVQLPGEHESQAGRPGRLVEHFDEKNGLTSNYVRGMTLDREGNLWVGTERGLDQFRESAFGSVALPGGLSYFSLSRRKDGGIWAGVYTGGLLLQIQNGRMISRRSFPKISFAYEDSAGDLWMGTPSESHMFHLAGAKLETLPISGRGAMGITKDVLGRIWAVLGGKGLFRYDHGEWTSLASMGAPEHGSLSSYTDAGGRVWFGFLHNRVALLDGEKLAMFSEKEGVQVGDVKTIVGDQQRVLIAGDYGLEMFDGHAFVPVTPSEGPAFSAVSAIVPTENDGLWIGENRGVIQIPPSEFRALDLDPRRRVTFRVFDSLDGIPTPLPPSYPGPSAVEGNDGLIYFATETGLVWINPKNIPKDSRPPKPVILSLSANGAKRLLSGAVDLRLPARTTGVQIAYTAPSLTVPERVRFRYRLEGTENWQDVGTRREAIYTNLGPGSYRFDVITGNSDGLWNDTAAVMSFVIEPAYYQTWWFQSCYVLLAAALLWVFYRYRLGRETALVQQRLGARVQERERIARELHDTLLQSFQGLMLHLQVIYELLPTGTLRDQLEESLERGDKAIAEGRHAVTDLRSSMTLGKELTEALRITSSELPGSTDVRFVMEGTPRELHPLLRDEIYRIASEGLRNAFKHAQAQRVEAEVTYGERLFRLRIRDDGDGIPSDILESGRPGHFGLKGMRERARQNGIKLEIWSNPGKGTEIDLSAPASIAYAAARHSRWELFKRAMRLRS